MKRARPHNSSARKPRVGDRVTLDFGGHPVAAVVLEDRGPLGVDGCQILRVRLLEIDPESDFEVRADEVQAAT